MSCAFTSFHIFSKKYTHIPLKIPHTITYYTLVHAFYNTTCVCKRHVCVCVLPLFLHVCFRL